MYARVGGAVADDLRRGDRGCRDGQQLGGVLVHLTRDAVAVPEVGDRRRVGRGQVSGHLVPRVLGPRPGGLREVADQGQRAGGAAPGDAAQLHGRQVLGLIDDDVRVRAVHAVDQRRALVEERDVGGRPLLLADPFGAPPVQQRRLLRGQAGGLSCGEQPRPGTEQVAQERGGGQLGPQPLGEVVDGGPVGGLGARTLGDPLREPGPQDGPALGVGGCLPRQGEVGVDVGPGQRDEPAVHKQPLGGLGGADPVGQRAQEQVGHARVALEPRYVGRLRRTAADLVGYQLAEVGQPYPVVAEGGQDVRDVPGERRVRADDEDLVGAQPVGLVEQQPRHPVQGDHRLAGAGAAGHDQHLIKRGADQVMLGRLNGGDNVAQLARAGPEQLGQQVPVDQFGQFAEEDLGEVGDRVALAGVRALAGQAERVGVAGLVERRRGGGLPVDHEWAVWTADELVADVQRLAVGGIDAAHRDLPAGPAAFAGRVGGLAQRGGG